MKKKSQLSPEQFPVINQSIAKYTQLIAENPDQAELHGDLGSLYAQKEQWLQAIDCYKRAIQLNPNFAGAYRNLARVFLKLGQEIKSVEFWYKALSIEPHWADAQQHYALGNSFYKYAKIGKAIACYRRAIKIQPDFLAAYQSLGKLLISREEFSQVIALYRQAVKHNPLNPQFRFCLAQTLANQQQWQQAIAQYRKTIELDRNFAAGYYGLGLVFAQQEQWNKARKCYQKATEVQSKYWEAYHQLGHILEKQQKWNLAIAAYQNVLHLYPQFIPAYLRLAAIKQHQERYQQAFQLYCQAIELAPELSEIEQQTISAYQKAVYSNPQANFKQYHQLATILRSKSFFSEAISAYQKAIELNPKFLGAYLAIQYTNVAPEQLEQLIGFYRQIVAQHPHIDIAWGNLGDALAARGNIQESITCYQNSCYQRVINAYPHLAELDWQKPKQHPPDFIIIGAAKCGTSSLFNYLQSHPQVLAPHKKEISFFGTKFNYGIDWYLAHFPSICDRADFITGEATPNYIRFPEAAQQIKTHFPQTKLIILLRNPIERALSWHHHKLNSGLAKGSFAEAIVQEIKQLESFTDEDLSRTVYHNPDNIIGSLYIYKLKIWLELFAREQFCLIKSEDLYNNPEEVMKRVFTFLGLKHHSRSNYHPFNVGSYRPISSELRATLADYFQPHNQKLEEYLDMELNWN